MRERNSGFRVRVEAVPWYRSNMMNKYERDTSVMLQQQKMNALHEQRSSLHKSGAECRGDEGERGCSPAVAH